MRNSLSTLLAILTVLCCTSCFSFREYPVEYDYNYLGNFTEYETFGFFEDKMKSESPIDKVFKDAIINHMELLGYSYDEGDPNLLVNYTYFSDSLSYRGYLQPDMLSFLKYTPDDDKEKEEYNKRTYSIKKGTLVINITDLNKNTMVWQGYTTDLYNDDLSTDARTIRIAVRSILNNYKHYPTSKDKQNIW
jgi:hypothetical protein